jgi:hypothetical protein
MTEELKGKNPTGIIFDEYPHKVADPVDSKVTGTSTHFPPTKQLVGYNPMIGKKPLSARNARRLAAKAQAKKAAR